MAIHETKPGGRALTFDTPMDKLMTSLLTGAAEIEKAKVSVRTRSALQAKFERGHVVGGTVFGYKNIAVLTPDGKRSHVTREIHPEEAAVVREIFARAASGDGCRTIAKRLNATGAPCPVPRRHVQRGWAPSSVRVVLHNDLYRGEVVWGRVRSRDARWGHKRPTRRPPEEWHRAHDERLRIIDEPLWAAVHEHLAGMRARYLRHADGRLWGRPVAARSRPTS